MFKKILGILTLAVFLCAPGALATEHTNWSTDPEVEEYVFFSGTSPFSTTLAATPASKQGAFVRFTSTGHGFALGSYIYLDGPTAYIGMHEIKARAANTFDVHQTYSGVTPAGTENVYSMFESDKEYQFLGFELHFSAAPTTSENLVVTKDAEQGSAFDVITFNVDMSGVSDYVKMFSKPIRCESGDKIKFTYDNTDLRTYGIKMIVRRKD